MDSMTIFIILVSAFAVLLSLGTPIFAALGVSSVAGIILHSGFSGLQVIPPTLQRGMGTYTLIAIPLFILMGEVIARTSIGGRLYHLFYLITSRLPGGLAVASIGSSAVFGAMSGVSVAGAATIGRFAIPEMLKRGYDPGLSGGSIAAAGALALLIPPSIGFVLYGEIADQSIGKLFIAAIIPALLIVALMVLYVVVLSYMRPELAPRHPARVSTRALLLAFRDVWAGIILIFLVIGTIYLGIATPTESAGIGAAGAFVIALGYKELNINKIMTILRSTAVTSGMILLILAAALLFGYIMTRLMIPQKLVAMVAESSQPGWIVLVFMLLFLIIIGMFLDIVSLILITTPILLPVVVTLGYDPIWFGVIMIIACEMAVITPPVGLNLYVIKGIAPEISLKQITRGALPFVFLEIIAIVILTVFPEIVLWLPKFR
ncbi:TRAP transporter large permease [Pusillimonas sp. ANT_WB101]|uniref:TRAP transporter large permease n=1 Tax=Pusillimonas sp. ANT_WB101 TaxID=2597356 RepID=UPI0011F05A3B|nr:TRAP transporter large permease subunit [Pusillimonas sp. ANT_WB101]KAA0892821.1 TRAP transporter large permease subunit [Pusillimonas sp. ANT_WB101]